MHNGDIATFIARRRAYIERTPQMTTDHKMVALNAIDDLAVDLAAQMRFENPASFSSAQWLASCGVGCTHGPRPR